MNKKDGLHYFVQLVNEWKSKYHTDHHGVVVFQNKQTMTNVRFTNQSMHNIQAHARGVEQLPDTVKDPDEIWSKWEDVTTQRIVLRSYIAGDYVVLTKDGEITDGFLIKNKSKYRIGCLVIV